MAYLVQSDGVMMIDEQAWSFPECAIRRPKAPLLHLHCFGDSSVERLWCLTRLRQVPARTEIRSLLAFRMIEQVVAELRGEVVGP